MSKSMYGIAAGLALVTSRAWAAAGKSGETSERDAIGDAPVTMIDGASATSPEPRRSSEPQTGSSEARTSRDETPPTERGSREAYDDAWLQMREGYRDGGY
jgi:hypothetical protein